MSAIDNPRSKIIHFGFSSLESMDHLSFIYYEIIKNIAQNRNIVLMAKPLSCERKLVEKIILANSFADEKHHLLLAIEGVVLQYMRLYCKKLGHNCPILKNIVVVNGFSSNSKIVQLTDSLLKIKFLESKIIIVSSSATDMNNNCQYYDQSEIIGALIADRLNCDIEFYSENSLSANVIRFLESRNLNFDFKLIHSVQKHRSKRYKALR